MATGKSLGEEVGGGEEVEILGGKELGDFCNGEEVEGGGGEEVEILEAKEDGPRDFETEEETDKGGTESLDDEDERGAFKNTGTGVDGEGDKPLDLKDKREELEDLPTTAGRDDKESEDEVEGREGKGGERGVFTEAREESGGKGEDVESLE